MLDDAKTAFYWRMQGRQFGYPICCIQHFVNNAAPTLEWADYREQNVFKGTGFVACPTCNAKPVEVMVHINLHRDKSLPSFPVHEE